MIDNKTIEASFIGTALFNANDVCMSVAECAKFLGIHENTVKNRIHSKKIFAKPYGKGYSIPKIQFLKEILEKLQNQYSHEEN